MDEAAKGKVPPLAPGARIDRYELVVLVREDDAGCVWLAREKTAAAERLVALRFASPALAGDARFRELLRQEVKLASGVAHPNVAQVLELGDADGIPFVASEWVDGDTLADLRAAASAKKVTIPTGIILRVVADTCAGLHAAHLLRDPNGGLLNVVHGDMSARSIVIGANGVARVIDLGFMKSRARHGGAANLSWLVTESKPPPGQRIDRHADVWGMGAILGDGASAGLPARGPRQAAPTLPHEIVLRARSTVPAERFATSAEMQGAIEAAMMTLGLGATHASVAAFAKDHLGARAAARADALRAPRAKPPAVVTILTPAVDSVPATVRTVRPEDSAAQAASEERPIANTPPIAATARTISRTLTRARRSPQPPRSARAALFVTGFSLAVIASGVLAYIETRGRSQATSATHAPAPPVPDRVAPPPKASCPAGMLEVIAPSDHAPAVAPFCLDTALVTTEAYKACSDAGDCKRAATENRWPGITVKEQASLDPLCHERDPRAHAKDPINCIDRDMAAVFCAAHGARLATEAEVTLATHRADGAEWSLRPRDLPTNRSHAVGFRCARSL